MSDLSSSFITQVTHWDASEPKMLTIDTRYVIGIVLLTNTATVILANPASVNDANVTWFTVARPEAIRLRDDYGATEYQSVSAALNAFWGHITQEVAPIFDLISIRDRLELVYRELLAMRDSFVDKSDPLANYLHEIVQALNLTLLLLIGPEANDDYLRSMTELIRITLQANKE